MIKVTFTNGTTKSYAIGCKQLGFMSWHHMDYRPMFAPIAKLINVSPEAIEAWRVA